MSVTGKLYGKVFIALFNAEIDFGSDTIKVALTTSSYTPDQDAHDYFNDVTNEITGTGYSAGGQALSGKTITYTGVTNKFVLDCDDPSWPTSTITARNAVFYDATPGSDATRALIGYQASSLDVVTSSGTLDLVINASGLVEITVG